MTCDPGRHGIQEPGRSRGGLRQAAASLRLPLAVSRSSLRELGLARVLGPAVLGTWEWFRPSGPGLGSRQARKAEQLHQQGLSEAGMAETGHPGTLQGHNAIPMPAVPAHSSHGFRMSGLTRSGGRNRSSVLSTNNNPRAITQLEAARSSVKSGGQKSTCPGPNPHTPQQRHSFWRNRRQELEEI